MAGMQPTTVGEEVQQTAAVWDELWRRTVESNSSVLPPNRSFLETLEELSNKVKRRLGPDILSLLVYRLIRRDILAEVGRLALDILVPGCGSGRGALLLARESRSCTLLDISPTAVHMTRALFSSKGVPGRFVVGSLFQMPWPDNSFDLVWNLGVMEHFRRPLQVAGLKEMHRVCRKGGLLITVVPCTRGKLYVAAKAAAERRGLWEVGYEEPVPSMRERFAEVPGCRISREYSAGFLWQLGTSKHLLKTIPNPRLRRLSQMAFGLLYQSLNRAFSPLNHLPGALLVTVCRKDN